jgi:hypothetical protein
VLEDVGIPTPFGRLEKILVAMGLVCCLFITVVINVGSMAAHLEEYENFGGLFEFFLPIPLICLFLCFCYC